MHRRHPPRPREMPRRWLMTDERMGAGLWDALAALPPGSGVILRHYAASVAERRALFVKVQRIARRRRLMLVVAGRDRLGGGAAGSHGRHHGALTAPVHSRLEAVAAIRAGTELLFVSPVYPTRSHADARTLGPMRLGLIIRGLNVPVIALGGMNARRWRDLKSLGVYGWAGIDAWIR